MIRLENISIINNMNEIIIKEVSLFIPSGSIISVDGKHSEGKTRLLNIIGLLEKPYIGNLYLLGKNIQRLNENELSDIHREIGIVFQENKFVDNFNLRLNIIFPLILKKEKAKDKDLALMELLPWLSLEKKINKSIKQLSNAELRLAQFARAIIGRPRILLLDNFFTDIEERVQKKINYLLLALNKIGTTIIIFGKVPKNNEINYSKKFSIANKNLIEINE